MKRPTLRYALQASLPVMAGYIVLGIGFGILLQSKGYAWWWACISGGITPFYPSLAVRCCT